MRRSGILMHITSLPGPHGVGTMGREAFSFVDFLAEAGQSCWQILPLNPTGFGDSPYQSCSTFAGNHYLIDLDMLVAEGLLRNEEIDTIQWSHTDDRVNFGLLYNGRMKVLRMAFDRFRPDEDFEAFCKENENWLPDFALFMALKDRFGGAPWYRWEDGLKFRRPEALEAAREALSQELTFFSFVQYLFSRQWQALRNYAHSRNIRIIGDVPIYVPYDSVEVWKEPELFQLDEKLDPTAVAGCPPDAFTAEGQLWGNPLYRWDRMAEDDYAWWVRRLRAAANWYDIVRMDHFRGLESYWSVPYGDDTARNGHWVKGPDIGFVSAVKRQLPELDMIAEDLGYLTEEVRQLRDASGFPGMKVLEFAFDPKEPSNYLPHTYTPNSVVYTGTHDNLTIRQWLETASSGEIRSATEYMRLTQEEGFTWGFIRTAFASVSDTCIIPMQDVLDLGPEARMNFPGTLSENNWTWRVKDGTMYEPFAKPLRKLSELYGRNDG